MMDPNDNAKPTGGYSTPSQSGKIPFVPPGTDLQCETAYWLWGDLTNDTPPLICLHGGPGSPGRYLEPLALLNEKYSTPVILYDQIGCGDSTHLPHTKGDTAFWTFDLFFAELKNLIKFFHIQTYDLLGHSWGGMWAAPFALTQPRGLRKLILCSTTAVIALRLKATARQLLEFPTEVREALEGGENDDPKYQKARVEFFRSHMCRVEPLPVEMKETMAAMQEDDTVNLTIFGPSMLHLTGPLKDFDIRDRLPEITNATVPGGVLITNGRFDTTQDEVTAPYFTRIRARVKWVQFAESSHMAMLEETERFISAIGEFLQMV